MMNTVEKIFDGIVDYTVPAYYSDVLLAIDEIQGAQNPPYSQGVYFVNLRAHFRKMGYSNHYIMYALIEPLVASSIRLNQLYLNPSMSMFSTKKIGPEWMTFSEGVQHKFPGFGLDTNNYYIENKSALIIDLQELEGLFRSKDIARYEQVKAKWFGPTSLFLDEQKSKKVVTYCTYPRSGNSMMRKHFENVTGIATGSDMVLKFAMNVALQYSGFKAEGIVDRRIWINKSHFPFRIPFDKSYQSDYALCCVRNPLDVCTSFFNMFLGMTHTNTVKGDFLGDHLRKYWQGWVIDECKTYRKWHDYWLNVAREGKIPVYFFRFEDVLKNKQHELNELMRFILGMDTIEGTVIEKRIQDVMGMSAKAQQVYKPRSGGVNKNLDKFTKEMLQFCHDQLEPYVHFFGYTKGDPVAQKAGTEFFDYKDKASQASLDSRSEFLKYNEQAWKLRFQMRDGQGKFEPFTINGGTDGINLITEKNLLQYSDPIDQIEILDA